MECKGNGMRELTSDGLKNVMTDLMCRVDAFCKANGIKYYLHAGTLLGAVRHKGFIPWDDDIDITMFREDYNKFVKLTARDDLDFVFVSYQTNHNFQYAFGKVCDKATLLVEKNHPNSIELGVYIDVFPLDTVPDDYDKAYSFVRKCNNTSRLGYMSMVRNYGNYKAHGVKKNLIKPFAYAIAKIMGTYYWVSKLDKLSQKYNGTQSNYVANCLSPNYVRVFERAWYDSQVSLTFENQKFMAPGNYDAVLKCMFKNYMELPPEEKRVTHHNFVAYYRES